MIQRLLIKLRISVELILMFQAEEMVPMINATQFEDDESDEENLREVWTDRHNQRSMMANFHGQKVSGGSGSTSPSDGGDADSTTTAVLDVEVGQVTLRSPRQNRFDPAVGSMFEIGATLP